MEKFIVDNFYLIVCEKNPVLYMQVDSDLFMFVLKYPSIKRSRNPSVYWLFERFLKIKSSSLKGQNSVQYCILTKHLLTVGSLRPGVPQKNLLPDQLETSIYTNEMKNNEANLTIWN